MFQEVKPKKKLREVLPKKGGTGRRGAPAKPDDQVSSLYLTFNRQLLTSTLRRSWLGKFILIFVCTAAILGLIFFASSLVAVAVVEVTPKQLNVALTETLEAVRSPAPDAALSYDLLTIDWQTASRSLKATGTKQLTRSASGQVVIYNNYSRSGQKLVANTRLEALNGKIFRLREPVVVPGLKTSNGKTIPGSVEVTVYAEEPGESYNLGLTDFVIPGFRDSPRFAKFYARSKTPLTGGFAGQVKVITPEEEERARAQLKEALRRQLIEGASLQIPPQFLLYQEAAVVSFREQDQISRSPASGDDLVVLEEQARLQGIIFNRQVLTDVLLGRVAPDFSGQPAEIQNLDQLTFTLLTEEEKRISFRLEGEAAVVAVIDQVALRGQLAGLKRGEIQAVLQQFPGIQTARVTFRPPWWNQLPADARRVQVRLSPAAKP